MTEEEREDIARKWFGMGKQYHEVDTEQQDNFFIEFMMYWVAFNCLYNLYEKDKNKQYVSERERIYTYCDEHKQKFNRCDVFSEEANVLKIFLEKPVLGNPKYSFDVYQTLLHGNEQEKIGALLQTLYQVRCNLFHGSKQTDNERDRELVKSAAIILKGYLEVLLDVEK